MRYTCSNMFNISQEEEPVSVTMHSESLNYEDTYDDTSNFAYALSHTGTDDDTDFNPYAYAPLPDEPENRSISDQHEIEMREDGSTKPVRFDEGYDENDPIRNAIREQAPYLETIQHKDLVDQKYIGVIVDEK
jgi:hypothetical protein